MSQFTSIPPVTRPISLESRDFSALATELAVITRDLLSMPVTMHFWSLDTLSGLSHGTLTPSMEKSLAGNLREISKHNKLTRHGTFLSFPLIISDRVRAVGFVDTGGNELFDKMSNDWLPEFQRRFRLRALACKKGVLDPATGLYNAFLLHENCDRLDKENEPFSLILIGLQRRPHSTAAMGLRQTLDDARYLQGLVPSPLYHLGNGVFALIHESHFPETVLKDCRRLLNRLKRRPCHRVHFGIYQVMEKTVENKDDTPSPPRPAGRDHLTPALQLLVAAAERGPYGICSGGSGEGPAPEPFPLPPPATLQTLRRQWLGVRRFALVLIRCDHTPAKGFCLGDRLRPLVDNDIYLLPVDDGEACLLLTDADAKTARKQAQHLMASLKEVADIPSVSMGISVFPLLDESKTATLRNCAKALRHGEFTGPGSITIFDSVSLNISGDYYFDQGNLRQAVLEYRKGLRLDPRDINLMNSLGVAYAEMNRHREAAAMFEQVVTGEPNDFMALVNLGHSYRMQGEADKALGAYEQAVEKHNPADAAGAAPYRDLLIQLAWLYTRRGRYRDALSLVSSSAGARQADEFIIHRIFGEALMHTGEDKKAMRSLQQALRHSPRDGDCLSMLGLVYQRSGQGDDIALSLCSQAVAMDGNNWLYRQRLGRVLFNLGKLDEARHQARKSLLLKKSNPPATLLMGEIYEKNGLRHRARIMYQRLLRDKNISDDLLDTARKRLEALGGNKTTAGRKGKTPGSLNGEKQGENNEHTKQTKG